MGKKTPTISKCLILIQTRSYGKGRRKTNNTSEDRSLYQKFKLQKVKRNYNDLNTKWKIEHGNVY